MQENLKDRAMMSQNMSQQQQQYYLPHQQQQQQHGYPQQPDYPQTSLDRVTQLKMERTSMLERQQQLLREVSEQKSRGLITQ